MEKKYRLGNQSEEYELRTKYLGWTPENLNDWQEWFTNELKSRSNQAILERLKNTSVSRLLIVSPDKKEKIVLLMDHGISKEAFPLEFFGEERGKDWHSFYIVAEEDKPEIKFIIPMH